MCRYEECPLRGAMLSWFKGETCVCRIPGLVTRHVYAPGATLLWQATPLRYLYFIRKGYVRCSSTLADGHEQFLFLETSGHLLGAELLDEPVVPYTATALTRLTACRVGVAAMRRALERNPAMSPKIVRFLSARLQNAHSSVRGLGLMGARERIARFFLSLSPPTRGRNNAVTVPIPYKDMANMLGLTAETLSRHLARMRMEGLLTAQRGRCFVLDVERLRRSIGLISPDGNR